MALTQSSLYTSGTRDQALWMGALIFIAAMAVVAHVVTDYMISDQEVMSEYATMADQQRLTPSRVNRLVNAYVTESNSQRRQETRSLALEIIDRMEAAHDILADTATGADTLVHSSPKIHQILTAQPYTLDTKMRQFIAVNRSILNRPWGPDIGKDLKIDTRKTTIDASLTEPLNLLIEEMEDIGAKRIDQLKIAMMGTLALILSTLAAVAVFVFNPLFKRLHHQQSALRSEIEDRFEVEQRLFYQANHDELTGLPNRILFNDRLENTLNHLRRYGGTGAVHLIDLDHFKDLNNSQGHAAGDLLLKTISDRLHRTVRESDTVARLGGDEFAVIQTEARDLDGIGSLTHSILQNISKAVEIDGHLVHPAASIGIAVLPGNSTDSEQVLRDADTALYRAKGKGRATYSFFEPDMHKAIKRHNAIARDLRLAIDRQEFILHYQPKLDVQSGRSRSSEALIRWNQPQQGFLSPAEFIPIAEKTKLIVPIGSWVLHEALKQVNASPSPTKVAVNLSAVQFREKNLVELVRDALVETTTPPEFLELEITETVAMDNAEDAASVFRKLSKLGVSLAIDVFGTGYSSLSYLKQFPVQRIKIDKAFVDDVVVDESADALVQAVVTLGHSFGMEVTAEGVETSEQLTFLSNIGCDEIQGYLHSKPLAANQYRQFLQTENIAAPPETIVAAAQ